MTDGKDELAALSHNQTNPYDAKASEFKPGGGSLPKEGAGMDQQDKLVDLSMTQECPRHTEDGGAGSGYGTPVPTDRSRVVSSNFKTMQSKAEEGTSLSMDVGVSFGDGEWHSGIKYKK